MHRLVRLAMIMLFILGICFSISALLKPTGPGTAKGNDLSINSPPLMDPTTSQDTGGEITSGWQTILNETFSGSWPWSGWTVTDLKPDNKIIYWGTDQYRCHSGNMAAWPARSGRDGRDPTVISNDYFNNMDTRMVFGPFNLSDANTANISFWMWWEMQNPNDFLKFEISHDNSQFIEMGRWSGTSTGWQQITISLDQLVGDNSVWVSWRFISNNSVVYDGPWIDDILIQKFVVGTVDVEGTVFYNNRKGYNVQAIFTKVMLYDADRYQPDDIIAEGYTDVNGDYKFLGIENFDNDDYIDPDHRLDLYIIVETYYEENDITPHENKVTNFIGQFYTWSTPKKENVPDGTYKLYPTIYATSENLVAMWIFQDINYAWNRIFTKTNPPFDPGSVSAKWEKDAICYPFDPVICNSFFYGGLGGPFIFISDAYRLSSDAVIHEASHNYMYNSTGWWWSNSSCWNHNFFVETDVNCAWSEGWAEFLPLVVNGDHCFDFGIVPCTGVWDIDYFDLENHGQGDDDPTGDIVEGRIAGALLDIYDDTDDGYDSIYYELDPIVYFTLLTNPVKSSLQAFWEAYSQFRGDHNNHGLVKAIYQNTIDYDTPPRFTTPIRDLNLYKNFQRVEIDLGAIVKDDERIIEDKESSYLELNYMPFSSSGCIVSINSGVIMISPVINFVGICDVIVTVDDGLPFHSTSDEFQVIITDPKYAILINIYFKLTR